MNFLMEFFRDVLSGIWYYLYLIFCIILFFYVLGIVADRKRLEISKKLKEKKTYDIESGKEAQIAAMESKQVLSTGLNEEKNEEVKKQEEPVVISSEPSNNVQVQQTPTVVQTQSVINNGNVSPQVSVQNIEAVPESSATPNQNQSVEPLVINSNE